MGVFNFDFKEELDKLALWPGFEPGTNKKEVLIS
jgi:hypothetical protein